MTAAEIRTNLQEFKAGIRKTLNDPVADWTAVIPVVVAMLSGLTIYTGEVALQLAEINEKLPAALRSRYTGDYGNEGPQAIPCPHKCGGTVYSHTALDRHIDEAHGGKWPVAP